MAILWAAFWTWFGLASGLAEKLSPAGVLVHTAAPGLAFVVLLVVSWRWELPGGILLVLAGVAVAVVYPMMFRRMPTATVVFVILTMALPPILAGILFLLHWWMGRLRPA